MGPVVDELAVLEGSSRKGKNSIHVHHNLVTFCIVPCQGLGHLWEIGIHQRERLHSLQQFNTFKVSQSHLF